MNKTSKWIRPLCMILLVIAVNFQANAGEGVTLKVMVEQEVVVVDDNGKKVTRRIEADTIVPGDEVIYTIHYLNRSSKPADNVFITIPVPEHTTYRSGSARGGDTDITFSVDGGKRYGRAEELSITPENGVERPATASDYTHIKWKFRVPLPPGASGAVSYRAVLN